ncbi:hypothetical protein AVEN_237376-1 [Araneus ventricosus]|uniref:Uncharacterized protein n=1 Tax=Araneus ventricosus TaxID=182803 RepID=A0A4Y2GWD7_ARAVE|nr:hypothetical protein AVEN_237376-1 [Araneus ventricosus]
MRIPSARDIFGNSSDILDESPHSKSAKTGFLGTDFKAIVRRLFPEETDILEQETITRKFRGHSNDCSRMRNNYTTIMCYNFNSKIIGQESALFPSML